MLIKPFRYQIAVGDWVMYNPGLYNWLIDTYPSMSDEMRDHDKSEMSKKYKVYDIGIFKRSGLMEVRLQESHRIGAFDFFIHTLNPDGTSAGQGLECFPDQLLVKVSK